MEFHIPTLNSKEASQQLKETILTSEPEANISIDLETQKIIIESEASPETFRQLIVASGHEIN
jgi:copper chaperone